MRVLSGTYLMPLEDGNQLAMYAVVSHSNVASVNHGLSSDTVNSTSLGKGNIYGARWVIPMPVKQGMFHSVTLGVDYKDFASDTNSTIITSTTSINTGPSHTPISYIPLSVGYNLSLPEVTDMTTANVTLNFKLRGVGDHSVGSDCDVQPPTQFQCNRNGAKPDYFYVRGGIDRTQSFLWGTSLYAKLDGQMAGGPLISNEQFVAGGADSVRGYLEAEQVGDDGVHGTLELRGPQWASGQVNDLRVLAFYDAAHLRVVNPVDYHDLASDGVGLRIQAWTELNVRLDVGWPIKTTWIGNNIITSAGKVHVAFKATLAC